MLVCESMIFLLSVLESIHSETFSSSFDPHYFTRANWFASCCRFFFVFSPDSLCVAAGWHQLKNVSKSQIPCGAPENLHCEPNISSLLRRSLPTFRVIMARIYVNYPRGKNHPVHQKSGLYAARGQAEIFSLPGNWNCNCGTFKIGVTARADFPATVAPVIAVRRRCVTPPQAWFLPAAGTGLLVALVREQEIYFFFFLLPPLPFLCLPCLWMRGCILTGRLQHDATRVQMAPNLPAKFAETRRWHSAASRSGSGASALFTGHIWNS